MDFSIFKAVFSTKKAWVIFIVAVSILSIPMFYFTDFELIYWNMGPLIAYLHVSTQMALAILFGINIVLLWHKLEYSAKFSSKDAHSTSIGALLGLIVSGCPSCGISLASYLGLGAIFSALPLFGIELKIIGILLLLYSISSLSKNMYS